MSKRNLTIKVINNCIMALNDYYGEPTFIDNVSTNKGIESVLSGATPSMLHANWMEYKHNQGWVYGLKKDVQAKTHPCMVPYESLPELQKIKDILFHEIAESLER